MNSMLHWRSQSDAAKILLSRASPTWSRGRIFCSLLALAMLNGCGTGNDRKLMQELEEREKAMELESHKRVPVEYPTTWRGSRTETLTSGVHVIGELFPSAAYIVETSVGPILFDAGADESALHLRSSMVELGLVVGQTKHVFLTHAHYDHVFGANKIRQVSGAIVCAGREDCETLRSADQAELFSLFPRVDFTGTPIQVDRELIDGDVIDVGDVTVSVIGAPGHTPGSVCYLVEKDQKRILFSGDVIASLNMGPATYPVTISPRYRGNAGDFLNTINRLLQLEPPDLLLCGHPQQSKRMQPLSLEKSQWIQLLQPAKEELERELARQQRDGVDFLDGIPKMIEPGLFYLGELDSTAVYALIDDSNVIIINSPGSENFAEFIRARFKELGLEPMDPTIVLLTSAERSNHSGIASLNSAPRVVAHDSGVAALREAGIENVASHLEFEAHLPPTIQVIPLSEHSKSLLAYSCSIGEKQVLVTPDVPRNIILVWTDRRTGKQTRSKLTPQHGELSDALKASSEYAALYRESLERLSEFSPDIWLPAVPRTGQNANLYEDDWMMLIEDNLKAVPGIANQDAF